MYKKNNIKKEDIEDYWDALRVQVREKGVEDYRHELERINIAESSPAWDDMHWIGAATLGLVKNITAEEMARKELEKVLTALYINYQERRNREKMRYYRKLCKEKCGSDPSRDAFAFNPFELERKSVKIYWEELYTLQGLDEKTIERCEERRNQISTIGASTFITLAQVLNREFKRVLIMIYLHYKEKGNEEMMKLYRDICILKCDHDPSQKQKRQNHLGWEQHYNRYYLITKKEIDKYWKEYYKINRLSQEIINEHEKNRADLAERGRTEGKTEYLVLRADLKAALRCLYMDYESMGNNGKMKIYRRKCREKCMHDPAVPPNMHCCIEKEPGAEEDD